MNNNKKYIISDNSKLVIDEAEHKKYDFFLKENSYLEISYYKEVNDLELNVYLEGKNSEFIYNYSTLLTKEQNITLNIFHKNKNTKSNIINKAVILNDKKLNITINAKVEKGALNSYLNQETKIITNNKNNCLVKPNLLIDEYTTEAKHSCSIGTFNKEQLFYLKARGIDEKSAINLMIEGFLKK